MNEPNPSTQYTSEGMPYLTPEIKLNKGEIILVDIPPRYGQKSKFCLAGFPDRDGKPTYLPLNADILTEAGDVKDVLKQFGVKKVVDRWQLSPEIGNKILESAQRLPLVLAVDRVLNHGSSDSLSEYPLPSDSIPIEMIGITGKPQTGKTRFLIDIMMEAKEGGATSHISVVDLDDMSPESLNQTMSWLEQEMLQPENVSLSSISLFDKVQQRVEESAKGERKVREKSNLRDQLAQIRQLYKSFDGDYINSPTKVVNEGGWIIKDLIGTRLPRKRMVLVDLPGVNYDESNTVKEVRRMDLFDMLWLSMPQVELFNPSPGHMEPWYLPLERDLFDKYIVSKIIDWQTGLELLRRNLGGRPLFHDEDDVTKAVEKMNLKFSPQVSELVS